MAHLIEHHRQTIDQECQRFARVGDKEALHDLRVAMRRLHSLFAAFSTTTTHPHAEVTNTLRQLLKQTNHARDLEVTLCLIHDSHIHLPWLEQQWQSELASEYTRLRHLLPEAWHTLSPQTSRPPPLQFDDIDAQSLGQLTATLLTGKIRQLRKGHKRVCREWDDEAAHKLRITGKKIRYLLEPFGTAVDSSGTTVHGLRNFQDLLGSYHDIVVLSGRLRTLQESAGKEQSKALKAARKHLARQGKKLRQRFIRKYCGKSQKQFDKTLQKTVLTLTAGDPGSMLVQTRTVSGGKP